MNSITLRRILVSVFTAASLGWFVAAVAEEPESATEQQLEVAARHTDDAAKTHGDKTVQDQTVAEFTSFAGSKDSSKALVTGLRNGTAVTLTNGTTTTT